MSWCVIGSCLRVGRVGRERVDLIKLIKALAIADTLRTHHSGQERFRSLAASFFRGADGCILACSSTDPTSVDALADHFAEFRARCPVEDDDLANFAWAAAECKVDLDSVVKPRRLDKVLEKLVPIAGGGKGRVGAGAGLSRAGSRLGSPELGRKESQRGGRKRGSVGVEGTEREAGVEDQLASTPPNPARPSTPPPASTPPAASTPPTTSLISVAHVFSPPAKQKHQSIHSLHSQPSLTSTFSSAHTADISNISIYHTPSSSIHNQSTDSLNGSEHTITPGSATPSINSDEDPYAEQVEEEMTVSAMKQSAKFGIDPFLSSSPPHAPAHLGRLPDPKLIYSGGPSTVPFDVDAPPPPPKTDDSVLDSVCHDCPGDPPGPTAAAAHDYSQDGVPLFRTSAKTGEGVDELFEYVARRVLWKWAREEEEEEARRRELGGGGGRGQEVIRVGADGKERGRKGWRGACCA